MAKAGKYGGVIGNKPKGSAKSPDEHMARMASKQTQRETGRDFGKSESTVSRRVMRSGFVPGGSAR